MALEFLERLLPENGYLCAAKLLPGGVFSHRFFNDIAELYTYLTQMDLLGHTMYLAQSGFASTKNRKQENVCAVRSFWLDIDCGAEKYAREPDKSYPTQAEAAADLKRVVAEMNLPFPTVVNSGNGLYAHWCIDQDIEERLWKSTALLFKGLLSAHGFKADPQRTADSSSVLRPPGTTNRKNDASKPVRLLTPVQEPVGFDTFLGLLQVAAKIKKVSTSAFDAPKVPDINATALEGLCGQPSSAHRIADYCAFVRRIRDTGGDVSEPAWYAAIGLLRHTVEGREIIHLWSEGHAEYDYASTEAKIDQHTLPPTTCYHIGSIDSSTCIGCPSKDKIKSPIVLGYPKAAPLAPPEVDTVAVEPPEGFSRTASGVMFDDGSGQPPHLIYPADLYPVRISRDHSLGYETVTFRHANFSNGLQDITIKTSLFHDPKSALMALTDQHVQVAGMTEKKLMVQYCEGYIVNLRKATALSHLHTQMGWHEVNGELVFVLGEQLVSRDGVQKTGLAHNIPPMAKEFRAQGDPALWTRMTEVFNSPGMEPLAFALLAGAFGAPLLRFTGHSGALLSLVGQSGAGKTLVGRTVMSVYGSPDKLILLRDDTRNMLITRLGLYNTLPLYIDEITNIDPMELSNLVYRVTQGRDKGRLGQNAVERAVLNYWNTIALASSNASLVAKLSHAKADASAEINRVFEYYVPPSTAMTRETGKYIHETITQNFGGVGQTFIHALVANQEQHHDKIEHIINQIVPSSSARSEERFWYAIAGSSLYGGVIAKKLGLVDFDLARILSWVRGQLSTNRAVKEDHVTDPVAFLCKVILELMPGIIVTEDSTKRHARLIIEPRGVQTGRLEKDREKLYLVKDVVKRKAYEANIDLRDVTNSLRHVGVLTRDPVMKNMGSGTHLSSVQVAAWEIDLKNPLLGHVALQVVQGAGQEEEKKGVRLI